VINKPEMYDNVDVKQTLEAGGYVLKIVNAEYVPTKDYVVLHLDIAEGPFKDYFKKKEYNGKWSLDAVKYLSLKNTEGAVKALKSDITSIERSNNITFDWNEKSLINKKVGGIFGKVQYQANDGTLKFRVKLKRLRSVEAIVTGDFEVPAPEYLDLTETGNTDYLNSMREVASSTNKVKENDDFFISDDDLPF
jgi:hypothetical protein